MSNLANIVGFDGIKDMPVPDEMKPVFNEMIRRMEAFRNDLIHQLRSDPTAYYADPDNEPAKIAGSKAGDFAIWIDDTGTSQIRVLE